MGPRIFPQDSYDLVREVLQSGLELDNRVELEAALTEMSGTDHAVVVATGAAALHTLLVSLGVNHQDEVLISGLTDYGSWTWANREATVRFVEVDPLTGNVTPEMLERAIGPQSRFFILTHLYGLPADLADILDVCQRRNLILIEDCCQAMGATYRGEPVSSFGRAGVFSFGRAKHVTSDVGGALVTSDQDLAARCRRFAIDRGAVLEEVEGLRQFVVMEPGTNYRLSSILMAVTLGQLRGFKERLARSQEVHQKWREVLEEEAPGDIRPIPVPDDRTHSCWMLPLHVPWGETAFNQVRNLCRSLIKAGFPASIRLQYYGPLHKVASPSEKLPQAWSHVHNTLLLHWQECYQPEQVCRVLEVLAAAPKSTKERGI